MAPSRCLKTTLTDFQGVVGSYQDLINRYRSMIQSLQTVMLRLVTIVPVVVTFFLFWLALLQVLALVKGWEWLRGGKAEPEPVTVSAAPPAALTAAAGQAVAKTAGTARPPLAQQEMKSPVQPRAWQRMLATQLRA